MKSNTLLLLLFCCIKVSAQEIYTPVSKAGKTTENIALSMPDDMKKLYKLIQSRYPVTGIKMDIKTTSISQNTECMRLLGKLPQLETLELYFNGDSLNLSELKNIQTIKTVRLFNMNKTYQNLETLNLLPNLECAGFTNLSIHQIPISLFSKINYNETELLCEPMQTLGATEIVLGYNDSNNRNKRIYISSYCGSCDLSTDSMKAIVMANIPGASTYQRSTFRRGGVQTVRTENIFKTPNGFKPLRPVTSNEQAVLIDPNTTTTLAFNDQSILSIPPGAFIDKNGKTVTDDIVIAYRSIRTPEEILSSGIPMDFDSGGQRNLFKTNGMFEIRAYAGNEELQIKNGSSLSLNYLTKPDSTKYNLYRINDQTGNWNSLNNTLRFSQRSISYSEYIDKTSFEDRYSNLNCINVLPENIKNGSVEWNLSTSKRNFTRMKMRKNGKAQKDKIRSDRNLIKILTRADITDKDNPKLFIRFNLNRANGSISLMETCFPELRPFDNFEFELEDYMKSTKFRELYKKNKVYNDIRIYFEPGDNYGIIELKSSTGFTEIRFKTYRTNAKGAMVKNISFIRLYRKYQRLLNLKARYFNIEIIKIQMSSGRYNDEIYNTVKSETNAINVEYKIDIKVLGFFNCDQLYRIKNPLVIHQPVFVSDGKELDQVTTVYVVDKSANGTYTFPSYQFTMSLENTSGILITDKYGDVYTIKGKDLKSNPPTGNKPIIQVNKAEKRESSADLVGKL
ncbi:MAG: hypothetical protein ACKOXF_11950 [Chitinophagaceae bacterium]